MKYNKKYISGVTLTLLAAIAFFPGILMPMFSLNMEMMANLGASQLTSELVDKELSIIATVQELWQQERLLVAFLIFFFSVCIPLVKTGLVSASVFVKNHRRRSKLLNFVTQIGKWSMADVFVVAIFLAVLSTNHASTSTMQEVSLGMFKITFEISSQTLSQVGPGFYFFAAYCLLSLAGSHLCCRAGQKE